MKLVTFTTGSGERVGALTEAGVVDLTSAGVAQSMIELIRGGASALEKARAAIRAAKQVLPLASVRLLAPLKPGKTLCSGINYKSHADENPNAKMPSYPHFFAKVSTAITGPNAPVEAPAATKQMDYEVEFAAVIGSRLTRPAESEVMPAIFGYTLLNDISARDVQFADNQITTGKNFDGFAPIGPCIVTADEMPHPDRIALKARVNGRLLQDGNTADWLFPLPRLIGYLAGIMTLEPGDVVTTGTPAGVGYFQSPQIFLQPGDVVEIEAEGIGVLRNPIVAPGTTS